MRRIEYPQMPFVDAGGAQRVSFRHVTGGPTGPEGPDGPQGAPGGSDTSFAGWVNDPASETHGALAARFEPRESIRPTGLVLNGTTDNAAAINAAITAANENYVSGSGPTRVQLPWAPSGIAAGAIVLKTGVTLSGQNRVLLKRVGAASSNFVQCNATDRVTVEGLTIDGNGLANTAVVNGGNATNLTLRDLTITDPTSTDITDFGVSLDSGAADVLIERCRLKDIIGNSVRAADAVTRLSVRGCEFVGWGNRGVFIVGDATGATTDLRIEDNIFRDGLYPADPAARQPIAIQGHDDAKHKRVHINRNTIIGRGTSHTNTVSPGTADQISLHRCDGFEVTGNITINGGDVGITIAQQCENGVVSGNVCEGNDSLGIALGSGTTTSLTDIAITGNTCRNNGKNGQADRPTWARAGINVRSLDRGSIVGNTLTDTLDTQVYGITFGDTGGTTAANVHVGPNNYAGNTRHLTLAANAGMSFTDPPRRAELASDQTVNNSTTLVDTLLTIPVDTRAEYDVVLYLPYNSSTTADFKVGVTVPTGTTFDWIGNGPASTTTSPNTVITRTRLTAASTATLGGTGGDAVATPVGKLKVGTTGGSFTVQIAQNTADASDTKLLAGARLVLTRTA